MPRGGDRAAESALAERAARHALQTTVVAMGDIEIARDVSQEVAVRVLRGIGGLREPERFDGWVFRITVAEIRRSFRRRRRHAEVSLESHRQALSSSEQAGARDPGEMLFASVELKAALADLTLRERTAVALRYVHDLDDEQIAAAMRCRQGTVRSLLSRARAHLRANPALAEHAPAASETSAVRRDLDFAKERSS